MTKTFVISNQANVLFHDDGEADRLNFTGEPTNFYADEFYQTSTPLEPLRAWQARKLFSRIGDINKFQWLDIGCGPGQAVKALRELGCAAHGIDAACKTLPEQGLYRISLQEYLQSPDQPVKLSEMNGISLLDVLEHFEDPKSILQSLFEKSTAGTYFVIKVPNKQSPLYQMGKRLGRWGIWPGRSIMSRLYQINYDPPHFHYYDMKSIQDLVTEVGISVVDADYLSETPLKHLWQRLWGLSWIQRAITFAFLSVYEIITPRTMQDALVVVGRK